MRLLILALTAATAQSTTEQGASLPRTYYSDTSRLGRPMAKDPSVVEFGGRYLMYYSIPPAARKPQSGGWPTGWAIGIAESRDLVEWRKIGELLPQQAVEANGIAAPGAVVIGGRVHLFYQTYGNGRRDAINHAMSRDGVAFERDPSNPVYRPEALAWSSGRAIDAEPFVDGEVLRLYYATRDPSMKRQMIGVAEAPLSSGFRRGSWRDLSRDGPILAPELKWERDCIEAPSVIRRGDRLFMFYAGGYNNEPQQVGVAESRDGVRWRRVSDRPVLANGSPGSWNSSESGHPAIFVANGKSYLFYQGNDDRGRTWGIARATITWSTRGPVIGP